MENKNLRMILYWIYLVAVVLCAALAVTIYFVDIHPANVHKDVSKEGTLTSAIVRSYETNTRITNGIRYFPVVVHFEVEGVTYEGKTNYAYTREETQAIIDAGNMNIKYKMLDNNHAIIVGAEFKETPISYASFSFIIGLCAIGVFFGVVFVVETIRKFRLTPNERAAVYSETREDYFKETNNTEEGVINLGDEKSLEEKFSYKVITLPKCLVYTKTGKVKDLTELTNFILKSEEYFRKLNPGVDCLNPNYSYILYGKKDEDGINLEYTQGVEKLGLESKTLKFRRLEGGKAASVIVTGNYSKLNAATKKLLEVLKTKNIKATGEVRFCYINGEWNTENPENYKTEIQAVLHD